MSNVVRQLETQQRGARQFAEWLRSVLAGPHDLAARAELKKALRRTRVALRSFFQHTRCRRCRRQQRRDRRVSE